MVERLDRLLSEEFAYRSVVVVRSHAELRRIVTRAPETFGEDPSTYRYDVAFLKEPLTATDAIKQVVVMEGVDAAYPGPGVL